MSNSFDYALPDLAGDVASGALGVFFGVIALLILVALAAAVVTYVLNAVSLYRIAKRRGIHLAWLAWIPVGSNWLLGSISDHYRYVAKNQVTKRRRVLLILGIVSYSLSIIYTAVQTSTTLAFLADAGVGSEAGMIAIGILTVTVMYGVAIATAVFMHMCYYDLYRSCKPANAVVFLVLGIIFSITIPFFLIASSGKDEGMPAKRQPQAPAQLPREPESVDQEPVVEESQPVVEPEEIPVVEAEVVETEIVEDAE